jgi:aldehyde dehydrogenase (NAD+)
VKRLIDDAVAQAHTRRSAVRAADGEIEPTVLTDVAPDAAVMQQEIFGPVLPVMTYRTLEDAFPHDRCAGEALVLYIFSRDRYVVK